VKSPASRGREFGLVVGVALAIAAATTGRRHGVVWAAALGASAALLVVLALAAPALLRWPADAWAALGKLLGRVTTPILLTVVFVVVVVPIGVLMRLFGNDALRLRRDAKATTYWIERKRRAFEPSDFERLS
jgi:hypothetical protein